MQTAVADIGTMRRTVPARRTKYPSQYIPDYRSVEKLIIRAAKKASLDSGISFEEMKAQADLLFVNACRTFDNNRPVKFSTFLHTCLHNGLINYGLSLCKHENICKSSIHVAEMEEGDVIDLIDEKAERRYFMVDFYNSLSGDEMELIDLVLLGFASSLAMLKKLAIERLGFGAARFDRAVSGITKLVREQD